MHIWPKSAACWSPAMPAMGTPESSGMVDTAPYTSLDPRTSGSMERGTPRIRRSSSSHSPVVMLKSRVREALLASVTWTFPPVSR